MRPTRSHHPNTKETRTMTIKKQYLNPDGSIKPLAELIGVYKEHDTGPVAMETARPHWFNDDGTKKLNSQIDAEAAAVEEQKQRIADEVRTKTERKLTP